MSENVVLLGRAIRHINDYSTIVLLDKRYARPSVQKKLPCWISTRLQTHAAFGPAFGALRNVNINGTLYRISVKFLHSTLVKTLENGYNK